MLMYYTVCYFTSIVYAVVRQIYKLFIDNQYSVLSISLVSSWNLTCCHRIGSPQGDNRRVVVVTWCFTPSQPVRLYQGETMTSWTETIRLILDMTSFYNSCAIEECQGIFPAR